LLRGIKDLIVLSALEDAPVSLSFPRRAVPVFAALCLACCTGCPIAPYEEKMGQEQQILDYWERENQQLADKPILFPVKKTKDPTVLIPGSIFFRPPKGVSITADAEHVGPFYRYAGTAEANFEEVLVDAVKSTKKLDEFKSEAFAAVNMTEGKPKSKNLGMEIRRPLHFEEYHEGDKSQPYLYLYKDNGVLAAFVFRPKANLPHPENVDKEIDYSLGSLVAGLIAMKKNKDWVPPVSSAKGNAPAPR
jgi:hypothetical protein